MDTVCKQKLVEPKKDFFHIVEYCTLKYGIMVPSGINVPLGKLGENNKRFPGITP